MVSHTQIVFAITCMTFFFSFSMMICAMMASQEDFVSPAYEGDGTNRMFKVDYGTTFTGVTTSFAAFAHFYLSLKQLKGAASEATLAKLSGATYIMILMVLQNAVVYGNELLIVQEIDSHSRISQECGRSNSSHADCVNICGNDGGREHWIRFYTPNKSLQTSLEAAVVFSAFMVLSMSVQAVLLTVWKDEIADPDYSGLANDAEGGNPQQQMPSSSPADGSYQKL